MTHGDTPASDTVLASTPTKGVRKRPDTRRLVVQQKVGIELIGLYRLVIAAADTDFWYRMITP